MSNACGHLDQLADVVPSSDGCEDCLRIGGQWVHLRMCMSCGHVGCCDNSPNRHATAHFRSQHHPLIAVQVMVVLKWSRRFAIIPRKLNHYARALFRRSNRGC